MKRKLYMFLTLLLLVQTILPGYAFQQGVIAAGSVVKNITVQGNADNPTVRVDWDVAGSGVEAGDVYKANAPAEVLIEKMQKGTLTSGAEKVGTYKAGGGSKDIEIKFNDKVENNETAKGHFLLEAVPVESLDSNGSKTTANLNTTEDSKQNPETSENLTEGESDKRLEDSIESGQVNNESSPEQGGSSEGTGTNQNPDQSENNETVSEDGNEAGNGDKGNSQEESEDKADPDENSPTDSVKPKDPLLIEKNILTGFELNYETEDGESTDTVDKDTLIGITYSWALENGHGYKGGATFTFQLPKELKVHNVISEEPMYFNGEVIGIFTVNLDGTVTIKFTDMIENYSNINGSIEIWTEIHSDTVVIDGGIVITPIKGGDSVKISIKPEPVGTAIEKKGRPNKAYNGNEIEWTIDFNKSAESLTNAELNDVIQDGQKLKEGSMKLYKLNVNFGGSLSIGEAVTPPSQSFPLNLGDINAAYRLVYTTEITDTDKKQFSNTATLTAEGSESAEATAEVSIQRGKPLEKQAKIYNKAEQSIEWEVRYNYNEKEITQDKAVLKDLFTNTQELVEGSVKVYQIDIDQENGRESSAIEYNNFKVLPLKEEGKNGFTLSFSEDIKNAYKITYKTKASDRVYDKTEIKNEVAAGDVIIGEVGQPIGPQILSKSSEGQNYAKKTTDWKIRLNSDQYLMKNVVIEDTYTYAGLDYTDGTLSVAEGGKALIQGTDFTFEDKGKEGFKIVFKKDIEKEVIIKYTTDFDYEDRNDKSKDYLENKAAMTWNDIGENERSLEAKAAFNPDNYTKANGFKNGSYNARDKEITWEVGLNYNLQPMEDVYVEDTFDGNQKLLKDSFKVYEMSLLGSENAVEAGEPIDSSEYDISHPSDNKFRLTFKNKVDKPYKIVYKTSLDEVSLVEKTYKNTAEVNGNNNTQAVLNATASIPYGGAYTEKSGEQNGKIINWGININFAQAHVSNVVIQDIPDKNQAIMPETFKLYEAEVKGNWDVTKGSQLTEGADYTVEFEEEPDSFTLKFTNKIKKPYILEYKTRILAAVGTEINNDVYFRGEEIEEQINSSEAFKVKRMGAAGIGTGEVGALTIVKKDADSAELLQGVKFELSDPDSGETIKSGETDKDGELFFSRLLYGAYVLKEIEAKNGYVGIKDINVTIDKPFIKDSQTATGNTLTVKNKKITGNVEVTKVDSENDRTLAGAVFRLEDTTGTVLAENLVTNEYGIFEVADLALGKYNLIETKAPNGYRKVSKPTSFVIEDGQGETLKLVIKNTRISSVPPVTPGNPEKPTDPVPKPEDPEKPTDPAPKPEDPEKPTDPAPKPEDLEKPTNPAPKPENPEKPTDPAPKPEKPTGTSPDNDLGKPVDPSSDTEKPNKPDVLGGNNKNNVNNLIGAEDDDKLSAKKNNGMNGKELPQTGEQRFIYLMVSGLLFILLGSYLLITQTRRRHG